MAPTRKAFGVWKHSATAIGLGLRRQSGTISTEVTCQWSSGKCACSPALPDSLIAGHIIRICGHRKLRRAAPPGCSRKTTHSDNKQFSAWGARQHFRFGQPRGARCTHAGHSSAAGIHTGRRQGAGIHAENQGTPTEVPSIIAVIENPQASFPH